MALRLSTKGRYGVRAVCRLAARYGGRPTTLQAIANKENIPIRYLEQIMVPLRRRGLLSSFRGPGGGYTLARPPEQIRVGEVLEILEGSLAVVRCVEEKRSENCCTRENCTTRDLWYGLSQSIQEFVNNISFRDLIEGKIDMFEIRSYPHRGAR